MRNLSRALVISSSIFGIVACSASAAPLGNDFVDAGQTTDSGSFVDSGTIAQDGGSSFDAGVDSGPVITGDLSCAGRALPTTAPASITIAGTVVDQSVSGQTPLENAALSAFPSQTSTAAISNANSLSGGAFSLVAGTGGTPIDGYLKASMTGEMDSYLYANAPLATSQSGLSVVMLTSDTYQLLQLGGGVTQDAAKGVVAVLVLDCESQPVAGATITTSPAGTIRYDGTTGPSTTATATGDDGIAYVFNVAAGDVTVNATAGSTALRSHHIVVRTGAFTTTLVTP